MSWKRLSLALLLVTLLYELSPVPSLASSSVSSKSGEGDGPGQAGPADVTTQAAQGRTFEYFFPCVAFSNSGCDHMIDQGIAVADARRGYSNVEPGDTVCIVAGNRGSLVLRNFRGTPEAPITFINYGGQVVIDSQSWVGILVQNSQFFRLSGSGTGGVPYGIKVAASTNLGVAIMYKSTDFEIDHIEVTGVEGAGIGAKTKAVCSDGSANDFDYDGDGIVVGDPDDVVNRSNFTQFNSVFHDNYIHHVGAEGFYVGSSFYDGRETMCSGGVETTYDPVLKGVSIYGNVVTDTGWDAVQVGSAPEHCDIHHNRVVRDSQAAREYQQGGISNNRGSACNIYSNFIQDGGGPGIYVQGDGGNRIYNNVITNVGRNSALGHNGGDGIVICGGSDPIDVLHNTIVTPRNYGIRFSNCKWSDRIQNNIIVSPGNYGIDGDIAYIRVRSTSVIMTNNLKTQTMADVKFTDPASGDFSIRPGSPAVDAGADPGAGAVTTDCSGILRPQGSGYDVGAYELALPLRP